MIAPIEKIAPIGGSLQGPESVGAVGESSFCSIFQSAVDQVRQTNAEMVEAEYLLATGQLDNPAALMIASSKNELAVSMLVQLRNKALESYSELTRISL